MKLRPFRSCFFRSIVSAGLVLVSAFVALGAGEVLLRLKNADMQNYDIEMWRYARELKRPSDNPVLGHEHRPSREAVLESVRIRINADGLRGPDVPPKNGPERRILFLGSSITLGWGVEEAETVSVLVENRLKSDGYDVAVLNAGIGNYNTVRYVTRFLDRLAHLDPDILVVQYFVNDAEVLEPGGANWFLRNSQLAVSLWIAFRRLTGGDGAGTLVDHYRSVYDPESKGYRDMKAALENLAAYARGRNIGVIVAMTPDLHDVTNYAFGFVHDSVRALAAELGLTYVDLLPAFRGLEARQLWAIPGDPHPNALGHRLMADSLSPPIEAMLMTTGSR